MSKAQHLAFQKKRGAGYYDTKVKVLRAETHFQELIDKAVAEDDADARQDDAIERNYIKMEHLNSKHAAGEEPVQKGEQ